MLVDILIILFGGAFLETLLRSHNQTGGWYIAIGLFVLAFFSWIGALIRLGKKESKTGLWIVLLLGLFLSFIIANMVSWFFGNDKKFWCNSCHYKYPTDFIVAESMRDGKICRYCLDKKRREWN